MAHILLISSVYPPEPVVSARLAFDLYKGLKGRGYSVKVLHPKPTRPYGFSFNEKSIINEDEIIVDSYTCAKSSVLGRTRECISFGEHCAKYIKEHKKEIISVYAGSWPLFGQFLIVKECRKQNIPVFVPVQDIYPESFCYKMPKIAGALLMRLLLPFDKYTLQRASGIMGISPSMINYLSKTRKISSDRFTLIRNWQEDQLFIDKYKPTEYRINCCKVMYLGSINSTANVPLIIKAYAKLNQANYSLSIIGNGPEKDNCIGISKQLGVNVLFEVVSPESVPLKQSEADILVLCLKKGVAQTATPSKLTAYMLTGRPIVASVDLESDCANIIKESGCGLVVAPDNVDDLSLAIEKLAKSGPDKCRMMGEAAYNYALKYLSRESNLNKLEDAITLCSKQ